MGTGFYAWPMGQDQRASFFRPFFLLPPQARTSASTIGSPFWGGGEGVRDYGSCRVKFRRLTDCVETQSRGSRRVQVAEFFFF